MRVDAHPEPPEWRTRAVVSAAASTMVGSLPLSVVGAQGPLLLEDLGNQAALLGLAVASFFAASAAASAAAGRLSLHFTSAALSRMAVSISAVMLCVIALWVRDWTGLIVALGVAGVGNAFVHVGANQLLALEVPPQRQGLAFGFKQASFPLSAVLGGASLPLIGLSVGWPWAFASGALLAAIVLLMIPQSRAITVAASRAQGRPPARKSLMVIMAGAGFASMAGNSLTPFLASSAVDHGLAPGAAGWLLALGSGAGAATRLGSGLLADRTAIKGLDAMVFLLGIGVAGFILLAIPGGSSAFVAGTVLAYAGGWGWAAVLVLAIVRADRITGAASMSVIAIGPYLGAVAGPALFGLVVDRTSYSIGWLVLGGMCLIGLVLTKWAASMMLSTR